MLSDPAQVLWGAARVTVALLTLRLLPAMIAFSAAPDCPVADRLAAGGAYGAIVFLAARYAGFQSGLLVASYAYLGTACAILYFVRRRWRSRLSQFAISFGFFLVVPGLLLSRLPFALLLGSEIAFSAFSYCRSVRDRETDFGDYLLFLLVNPVLVYSQRGRSVRRVGLDRGGLTRVLGGSCSILASGVVASVSDASLFGMGAVGQNAITQGVLRLGQFYLAHTGLAAVQIGLMAQLGCELPERYVDPLLARSPKDFWMRWNTYVGSWVRIYVYQPLTRHLFRRLRGPHGTALIAPIALIASFGFVGVFHDAYFSLAARHGQVTSTGWFLANAIVLLLWELGASFGWLPSRSWRAIYTQILFLCVAVAFAATFG